MYWVFGNSEIWKIHLSPKRTGVRSWNRAKWVHLWLIKRNSLSTIFFLYLGYSSYLEWKYVNQLFQDLLYSGVKKLSNCNRTPQGPCWVLAEAGFDSLPYLLGNWGPPSTICVFNISYILKVLNSHEGSGAYRRFLVGSLRVSTNGFYGLHLNVPGYILTDSWTVREEKAPF